MYSNFNVWIVLPNSCQYGRCITGTKIYLVLLVDEIPEDVLPLGAALDSLVARVGLHRVLDLAPTGAGRELQLLLMVLQHRHKLLLHLLS